MMWLKERKCYIKVKGYLGLFKHFKKVMHWLLLGLFLSPPSKANPYIPYSLIFKVFPSKSFTTSSHSSSLPMIGCSSTLTTCTKTANNGSKVSEICSIISIRQSVNSPRLFFPTIQIEQSYDSMTDGVWFVSMNEFSLINCDRSCSPYCTSGSLLLNWQRCLSLNALIMSTSNVSMPSPMISSIKPKKTSSVPYYSTLVMIKLKQWSSQRIYFLNNPLIFQNSLTNQSPETNQQGITWHICTSLINFSVCRRMAILSNRQLCLLSSKPGISMTITSSSSSKGGILGQTVSDSQVLPMFALQNLAQGVSCHTSFSFFSRINFLPDRQQYSVVLPALVCPISIITLREMDSDARLIEICSSPVSNSYRGFVYVCIDTIQLSKEMSQQVVEVSLINKLLGLPLQTRLEATLLHINELLIFRNNHHYCQGIIGQLQQEIAKIRLHMQTEIARYVNQKIDLAKEEMRVREMRQVSKEKVEIVLREIEKIPASLQEFIEKEFEMKFEKARGKSRRWVRVITFSLCVKSAVDYPMTQQKPLMDNDTSIPVQ